MTTQDEPDDTESIYDLGRPRSSDEPAGEHMAAPLNLDAVGEAARRITDMNRTILDAYSKIMPKFDPAKLNQGGYVPREFKTLRSSMPSWCP